MESIARGLSIVSLVVGLVGSFVSAYLFSLGKLTFENIFWIIVGLIFFIGIMVYQDINKELDNQRWEQKRLNEKLKIHERLYKLEKRVFENE